MPIANKKKLIYKVAKKLFEKQGIKKVSIDMIVQKAEIAKWTFYLYYKNKHELYEEILQWISFKIKQKIWQCNSYHKDIKQRLLYDFVWSYEFFQSQVIFKQIALWNQNYFSWNIDAKFMQKKHIDFLKSIFDTHLWEDINFELLAKLMSFYKNLDIIRINCDSDEEFNKYKLDFAAILVEWFFSDYSSLVSTFDKNKINKLIK